MTKKATPKLPSLRDAVAQAREKKTAASTGTTGAFPKTPAGYNRQHNQCIQDMINFPNPVVRMAILGNEHCPATMLRAALEAESDPQVMRSMLMNPRMSVKAIIEFAADSRSEHFDEDKELQAHIVERIEVADA